MSFEAAPILMHQGFNDKLSLCIHDYIISLLNIMLIVNGIKLIPILLVVQLLLCVTP